MNHIVYRFGLLSTYYDSPHGLPNQLNYSTADDQWVLISHMMKSDLFRKVVSTQKYEWSNEDSTYIWENTNKLLSKGFIGVKTGITDTAGPWLAAWIDKELSKCKVRLIIVTLNWKSIIKRWKEVLKITNWCWEQINEQIAET